MQITTTVRSAGAAKPPAEMHLFTAEALAKGFAKARRKEGWNARTHKRRVKANNGIGIMWVVALIDPDELDDDNPINHPFVL